MKKDPQVLDSDYSEFSATDPFNPNNHVEGQISFRKDKYYSSVKIYKIKGKCIAITAY